MATGFVLSVETNIADFTRRIDEAEKWRMPYVTATALTSTAYDIKAEEAEVMKRVFDRPTRFTLNSLYVRGASKTKLYATVEFREGFGSIPAWRYLGPQIMGGGRSHKSSEKRLIEAGLMLPSEYIVPGQGMKLDAYGNVSGSQMNVILSELGARADKPQNATDRSRRRKKRTGRYLVLRGEGGAAPGVYLRTGPNQLTPMLMFVRAPNYRPRFPFYETARAIMQRNFARNFHKAWNAFVSKVPSRRA